MSAKEDIKEIFLYALNSVLPKNVFKEYKELFSKRDFYLFGSGKAAYESAKAVEEIAIDRIKEGFVVCSYEGKLKKTEVFKSSHPFPSQKSVKAAEILTGKLKELKEDDFFIYLLSGGTSALIEKPIPPVTLEEFAQVTKLLLLKGASIDEINSVRKRLSLIKGGKLGSFTKAKGIVLVISDVIGDDLSTIGSAPFYHDRQSFEDPLLVLQKYDLLQKVPKSVKEVIKQKTEFKENKNIRHIIVANNQKALKAAQTKAEDLGYVSKIVTDSLKGDVKEVSKFLLQEARENKISLLFGGETTVEVKGKGKGGRNQELALRVLKGMTKEDNFTFLSAGSDGIDGNSDVAGAVVDLLLKEKAEKLKLDIEGFLKNNDSNGFFKKCGGIFKTSPTGTNVMDICIILKE